MSAGLVRATLAGAAAILCVASATPARSTPRVDLITMGPGPELYARFGHAGLYVYGDGHDELYNFGYTVFRAALIVDFVRGDAEFWGVATPLRRELRTYRRFGRSMYRQPLALTDAQVRRLVARLHGEVFPDKRPFIYHHFFDNCSTRLRDMLNEAMDGQLKTQMAQPSGHTIRDYVRIGFRPNLPLLIGSEWLLGRVADIPIDQYTAAFLPDEFSTFAIAVKNNGAPLTRKREQFLAATVAPDAGSELAGLFVVSGLLAALVALSLVAFFGARKARGVALVTLGTTLGLLGLPIWFLLAVSNVDWLAMNELALLLWPTDIALAVSGRRLLRGTQLTFGKRMRIYLGLRCAAATVWLIAQATSLFYQRPLIWGILTVAFGLLMAAAWRDRHANVAP